jgi:hypothetical protein
VSSRRLPKQKPKCHAQGGPDFDSDVIHEPFLAFGGRHEHVDPKIGIGLYGPYTLAGQDRPSLSSIIVGIVGPAAMISDAERWLDACRGIVINDGSKPFLYPHFPGCNASHTFQCQLISGRTWYETINDSDLGDALSPTNFYERVKRVVGLYIGRIEILSQREPRPNVIVCCIPQEVIEHCTVRLTKAGEVKRVKVSRLERRAGELARRGQLFLFPEMDPTLGAEDEERGHENLRRGLKAEAMQFGIPTQLVWPRTLRLSASASSPTERPVQDNATRAWNFVTALYHKAGGSPWRLADVEPGICFAGVSFYKDILGKNRRMRTSMVQTFTAAGDGYILRGNTFEWDESKWGKSPHLDQKSAAAIIRDVLELYKAQNRGSLPSKIVVHKTSKFWEEELTGFKDGCQSAPLKDFVALGGRGVQFYRTGNYPPLRGTYIKFSDTDLLLYTAGYIRFLRTYPGPRVPHPIEILEHHGDSPWHVVLQEILALTKMNWNTADFACREPMTIAFSRRVGQVLAELRPAAPMKHEYRFYM